MNVGIYSGPKSEPFPAHFDSHVCCGLPRFLQPPCFLVSALFSKLTSFILTVFSPSPPTIALPCLGPLTPGEGGGGVVGHLCDELSTNPLHLSPVLGSLRKVSMLSAHFFCCLPLILFPSTVPWRMVFTRPVNHVISTIQRTILFLSYTAEARLRNTIQMARVRSRFQTRPSSTCFRTARKRASLLTAQSSALIRTGTKQWSSQTGRERCTPSTIRFVGHISKCSFYQHIPVLGGFLHFLESVGIVSCYN